MAIGSRTSSFPNHADDGRNPIQVCALPVFGSAPTTVGSSVCFGHRWNCYRVR